MIYTDSFQMLDKPYNPGINQTRLHVIFIAIFIYSFNEIFVSMFTHDDIIHLLGLPWLFVTPWTAACQASLSFTVSWSFCKLLSIESMTLSNHTILCCPLFLLPSIFPSIRVFSNASALCIRWPKYWGFIISHSNEYSDLISFRVGLVWSPCCPRDSQESSPTPQFESINSSMLSLPYGPTLASIRDY